MSAPLSFLVQDYEEVVLDEEVMGPPIGDIEVFANNDPSWFSWENLAPFETLRKILQRWSTMIPSDREA